MSRPSLLARRAARLGWALLWLGGGCTSSPPPSEVRPPVPVPVPTLPSEWSYDADRMERAGRTKEELSALEKAVKDPRNDLDPHVNYRLARAYAENGRHEEAVPLFHKVIALGPTETYVKEHVYSDLARSLFALRRYGEAVEAYRVAHREDPGNANHLLGQARAELAEGRTREARGLVAESFKVQPGFALAYETLALIARQEGEFREAELDFRRALDRSPHLESALVGLEEVLRREGKVEEAEVLREKIAYLRTDKTYDTPLPAEGPWK